MADMSNGAPLTV